MSEIKLQNLTKRYGDLVAVDDVSVSVKDGELLCLLGPSGCGKSTTMRMISGLEEPTAGSVEIGGEDVTERPAYERNTSIVFQNWALFPNKSVLDNVAFGLKMTGLGKEERRKQAREMLERVHMDGYEDHNPNELSGGQKQRVALARSLAVDPEVLLLDEPLSNLDKRLREEMEIELKAIHESLEKTFVHVTHNQDEAFTLADRIGIMNDGKLVQIGPPGEVYNKPKNKFIEEFLGDTNFVEGTITNKTNGNAVIETEFGAVFEYPCPNSEELATDSKLTVSLRPEFMSIHPISPDNPNAQETAERADGSGKHSVSGTVERVLYRGSTVRYFVEINDEALFVERNIAQGDDIESGDEVLIDWPLEKLLAFYPDGTRVEA